MAKKHYTFRVSCAFDVQYTFGETEIQPDAGGSEADVEPTDDALEAFRREVESHLARDYAVDNVEAFTDSDSLLGIDQTDD